MSFFKTSLKTTTALPNSADAFGFKSRFSSSPPPTRTSFDDAISWRVTRTPLLRQPTSTLPPALKPKAVLLQDIDMEDLATPHLQWRTTPLIPKDDKKAHAKDADTVPSKMDIDVPAPLPRRRAPSTLAALISAGAPQRLLPPTIHTDLATAFAAVSIGTPPINVQAPPTLDILELAKAFEGLGMRDRVPTWREPAPMVVDEDDEDKSMTQGPAPMDVDEAVDAMDVDVAAATEDPDAMEVELPPCSPGLCHDRSILDVAFHVGCHSFGVHISTPAVPSTLDTYLSVKLSWAALL